MTAFRLPLPVSANDLVRPAFLSSLRCDGCGRPATTRPIVRLVSTREAKDFRAAAHRCLPVAPFDGPVEVYATFYVSTISQDADNRVKSLFDALKGRLFHDDVQVAEIHIVKRVTDDATKLGVVVEVRAADPKEHPELSARLLRSSIGDAAREAAQAKLDLPALAPPAVVTPRNYAPPTNVLPEPLQRRLTRLATSAVVNHRDTEPDDPEAA